ncbi:MAG: VOC family protein [Hyphomicrobiaceae bacterium]
MFYGIQHIGYLVADLDQAVAWFGTAFGAVNAGGTEMKDSPMVPGGGVNAFVRFGTVEVELMQPADASALPKGALVMHHIGFITDDIAGAAAKARANGLKMLVDAPYTNVMGQKVHYLDPTTTNGVWMHLTEVPDRNRQPVGDGRGVVTSIVHPGLLVRDLDASIAWYVEKLDGVHVGGGPRALGGRIAFVNCGDAQVELIEPDEVSRPSEPQRLDHVGYEVAGLDEVVPLYEGRGLSFDPPEVRVNPIGQRLIYFATTASLGARMHLTELPR